MRARLLSIIQSERARLVAAIDAWFRPEKELSLPPHRLNGLINSVAWHERRPGASQRLRELADELRRLEARAPDSSLERQIYAQLPVLINLERPVSSHEETLLRPLRLTIDEREVWVIELRLLLAQAAVEMIALLADIHPLRRDLDTCGGALRWQ
jgi:hypothetical protein